MKKSRKINQIIVSSLLAIIALTGCSKSDIDKVVNIAKDFANSQQTENNENFNIENVTLDKSVEELVAKIEIEEANEKEYDRDSYTSNSQYYEYNGNGYDSIRDYSFYASIYYNDKTGEYYDCYNGETTVNKGPKGFDFEHIVPLHWVNQHGGEDWSEEEKKAFADNPLIGVSVNQHDNRSKGDKGPSEWLPSANVEDYCYTWLVILADYDLSCSQEDMNVLLENVDNVPFEELDYLPTYK